MRDLGRSAAFCLAIGLILAIGACGGGRTTPPPPATYTLTVASTNPASGVAIAVSPADTSGAANGTTSFTRTYDAGTSVTLTAPATSGSNTFGSWTGCTSVSTVTCTVAINGATTVTANYLTPVTHVLTVNSTNPASGVAIGVSPADNNSATNGATSFTRTYNSGTSVTLIAPATAGGNNFSSWTGCTTATTVTCTATLNDDATVTANYLTPTYTLTVNSINPASGVAIGVSPADLNSAANGSTSFTRTYNSGTSVMLTAPATSAGNNFSSWTGCATANTTICNVTLSANTTVIANYATPTYVLTVNSTDPASGVAIGVSPADNNNATNGNTSFTRTYNSGASVTLTASTTSGSNVFVGWIGCTAANTVACNVNLSANTTVTASYGYVLTVNSTNPSSGVTMTVTYPPTTLASQGTTSFTVNGTPGETLGIQAPATIGGNNFSSWTGCTTVNTALCNVTLNANTAVTANYVVPAVAVLPNPATATIGGQFQFTAKVSGTVSSAVTWSVAAPSGSSLSPGTISSSGLYTTPYPAPATVTVKATSTQNTANSGSVVVTLSAPATTSGPALTVDTTTQTHAIDPNIYGMDAYLLHATAADTAAIAKTNIPLDRWGGDSTERYNYQLDVTNSIDDWYFENTTGNGGDGWPVVSGVKAFDNLVESNNSDGITTLGTVPVLGWVSKDSTSCSFPKTTYPNQLAVNGKAAFDPYGLVCGSGVYPDGVSGCTNTNGSGCNIPSDPAVTSIAAPPPMPPADPSTVNTAWAEATWTGGWINYLVNKFGAGSSKTGVAIYDLDNEPSWWSANSFDVHPNHFTYDEVTNGGIGTALAIKTVDPTAKVSGPVMDFWWAYFYSMQDIRAGWGSSPCYRPWSNPADRTAHGGVPFIEYYLQQFKAAEATYGKGRLLDYLDLHTYFAAQYPANSGNGLGIAAAGDTGAQQARLNSTRAFWDPTYTDSSTLNGNGYPQPNYFTDSNYTSNCNPPQQAPQLIRMMKTWVANDYPGTKLAIDEYNFGGLEAINGALAQADILGIFGREGLDLGAFWPSTDPSEQIPAMMSFAIYRNYDGNKSTFGNEALASTSTNSSSADGEGTLSVYGALRTADSTVTVVVINKTYGDLTSTLSIPGLPGNVTSGQAYLYSNANLNAILSEPAVTVTPGSGGAASTIANYTFPAQSITLFVVPM